MKEKIVILNGSPSGTKGNCAKFIKSIKQIKIGFTYKEIHLANTNDTSTIKKEIASASALIFITGTYWDSWGSPMQKFLEDMTELEGSKSILGKPAAVIVLMHSVGGKSVLSRLQGVLSTQGFLIPPMSGLVFSLVNQEVLQHSNTNHILDLWGPDDLETVLHNLKTATEFNKNWKSWNVDKKNPRRKWIK